MIGKKEETEDEALFKKNYGLSAFKNNDGMNYDNTPIYALSDAGVPHERIDVEALDASIRAFWLGHEKHLWVVLVCCCLYFGLVLI